MGAESVNRFTAADYGDALPTHLEVLEQEAEDRRRRRIGRLRPASRLPAGKTWETFEHDRVPLSLRHPMGNWPASTSSIAASTCWPSDCPALERPTHCAPWATVWWRQDARRSSPRHNGWCRACPGGGRRPPRHQARLGSAATTTPARQLRLPAAGRPGLPAPGC